MIYVGPFSGEIGYELLYWIPNVLHKFKDKLDQVTAISRGGTDSWYPCKVINFYDVMPPDEYRELYLLRKRTTGEYKQLWPDDSLDKAIMSRLGIEVSEYHPSAFYNRLGLGIGTTREFHQISCPIAGIGKLGPKFPPNPVSPVERYPGLPEAYVAIRFYENDFLKKELIKLDLKNSPLPLVGLVPKKQIDNHNEIAIGKCDYLVEYDAYNSLEVITRVVAHAKSFVVTYGGLSYIGPLCGVPTRALAWGWSQNKHTPAETRLGPLFHREIISQ